MAAAAADLAVIGYFAVLQRLALACPAADVGGGRAGELLPPTLTADAALVGLDLAARGWSVSAYLSHPGAGAVQRAAIALARRRFSQLVLGPDRGGPMELQILHIDREIVWYCDPTPGLRSLAELGVVIPSARNLYLDLFDWLEPLLAIDLRASPSRVYLNGGRRAPQSLAPLIARWRPQIAGQLTLQVSMPEIVDAAALIALAEHIVRAGADRAVVTASAGGIALAAGSSPTAYRPARAVTVVDASGAGAAVSAALIAAFDAVPGAIPEALIDRAIEAGAARCGVDGAADAASAAAWRTLVDQGSDGL